MTWPFLLILFVLLALLTWLSAVGFALLTVRRSALEERFQDKKPDAAARLYEREIPVGLAAALSRTLLRGAIVATCLAGIIGLGPDSGLTLGPLAGAAALAAVLIWLCASVIASALARHAPVGVIAGALPLLLSLDFIFRPLTWGLAFVDEAIRRLTGANLREPEEVAEVELLRSIGDSHREGGLDEKSVRLMENVVEFSTTDVGEVMTPRTDINGIEYTDDLAGIRSFIGNVGHSRIPVYEENLDHIVGILYVKDLVPYLGEAGADFELRPLLRQPIVVPETKQVIELLGDFQRGEVHMAMVIDEYGGTAGIVTIEDVLEELVGEIQDEHDSDEGGEPELHRLDASRAEVDGRFHLDDLNEQLGLELPEDEEFDTLAGFMLAELGRVPEVGEVLEANGARFTTLRATPTHVQRVTVEVLAESHPSANGQ